MKDNKEVVFMDVDQYQLILDNAQVGWWKADFEERCYICSDYLISLLELDGPKISIVVETIGIVSLTNLLSLKVLVYTNRSSL